MSILQPNIWNDNSYKEFIEYLKSLQDLKYKEFNKSIVLNSKYEMIGIRLPIIRKIAREISKGDIKSFLKYTRNKYYEEVLIEGLVISNIKDEKNFYNYFQNYIIKIDNWAVCDSFSNSIKIVRSYEDKYFKEALKLSLDKKEFLSRVGLVMILNHFIKSDNLNIILETINKIKSDKFYINMAMAWLLCEIYIKYPKVIKEFLKNNNLNVFTQNKTISKICDSYRVSKEEKELLKKYRK